MCLTSFFKIMGEYHDRIVFGLIRISKGVESVLIEKILRVMGIINAHLQNFVDY